jgi:hypothetical protein
LFACTPICHLKTVSKIIFRHETLHLPLRNPSLIRGFQLHEPWDKILSPPGGFPVFNPSLKKNLKKDPVLKSNQWPFNNGNGS